MRRIDENTHIDESLITSAEYQLFTDEMRGRGKYYQPDHWTSYQFPEGQAGKPILGVRYSDAEAFCEWLAQREGGEWHYRLPNDSEAVKHPIKFTYQLPTGYWIQGSNFQSRFAWIDPIPTDARGIVRTLELDRVHDLNVASVSDQPLDLDRAYNLAVDLARVFEGPLNRSRALNHVPDDSRDLSHNRILNLAHALRRDLSISSHKSLDRSLAHALDIAITLTNNPTIDLDLYIDLFTLQERIAGRLPAFEGIRIVKERVK